MHRNQTYFSSKGYLKKKRKKERKKLKNYIKINILKFSRQEKVIKYKDLLKKVKKNERKKN